MASEWRNITLGDFVTIQRGHDLTATERHEGNVPVLGAAGQNGFHDKAIARGPGIVIGRCGGSYGQVHYCEADFWPHNTGLYVTDFKGNDERFAFYLLKLLNFDSYNSGSAQPSLNRNFIYPIPVRVPLPAGQKAISGVLTALDAKIELNNRINAELEGMAKLLYDYWFVQFDFPMTAAQAAALGKPHLTGHPYRASGGKMIHNETLKREIPEGWTVGALNDICQIARDSVAPANVDPDTPYVGLEHVPRRQFFLDAWESAASVKSLKSRFIKGDVLFGKLRPYFHKVVRVEMEGICTSELLVLRPRHLKFEALLGSVVFSDQFVESTSKQWGGAQMPRADWSRMKEFQLPLPPDALLKDFNAFVLPLWKLGGANHQQNQELTQLRDWLLPMLMNGQVTVGTNER
jgi:type I restriction enzyme S subunit